MTTRLTVERSTTELLRILISKWYQKREKKTVLKKASSLVRTRIEKLLREVLLSPRFKLEHNTTLVRKFKIKGQEDEKKLLVSGKKVRPTRALFWQRSQVFVPNVVGPSKKHRLSFWTIGGPREPTPVYGFSTVRTNVGICLHLENLWRTPLICKLCYTFSRMGRGQVVRQWFLAPPFGGSNPSVPA